MKTDAQYKADERQRRKDAGLVAVTVYIHPSARERLRRYVARLNERAGKEGKPQG